MAELFADLKLAAPLVAAVEELGLTTPREMQSQLISSILTGRDVMVISSPGSGGTTGYLLGMMQHLLDEPPSDGRGPRALVLAPTRDQAMQVGRIIKQLGHNTRLRFGTVVGGRPYPTQHQLLRRPLDILVATPGRLMDHMHRGRVPFERLRFLLLDKANQMLDMGLGSEIYNIVNNVGDNLEQTVILSDAANDAVGLLSARLTQNPRKLGYEDDSIETDDSVFSSSALINQSDEGSVEEADQSANLSKAGNKSRNYHSRARSGKGPRRVGNARSRGNGNGPQESRNGSSFKRPQSNRQGNRQKTAEQTNSNPSGKPVKNVSKGPGSRRAGSKAGGQGRRGRRSPNVRFPSDYASGRGTPSKNTPVEPRGPQANEPVQYSADYGFSVAPGSRKPVNVVYRTKNRRRREEDNNDSDND